MVSCHLSCLFATLLFIADYLAISICGPLIFIHDTVSFSVFFHRNWNPLIVLENYNFKQLS